MKRFFLVVLLAVVLMAGSAPMITPAHAMMSDQASAECAFAMGCPHCPGAIGRCIWAIMTDIWLDDL